jgi:hypothetical protein
MIDRPEHVERLMAKLNAALPIAACVTPELQAKLREGVDGLAVPANSTVTWVSYAGDEGGIVCRLDFGHDTPRAVFASITHLRFDPRMPLAREITAYQRHRVKRLQRQPR